jgi:type VI protein secretion system component VasF
LWRGERRRKRLVHDVQATLPRMARSTQPAFGTRHRKPKPLSAAGDAPAESRRMDWMLVALVAIVFVAGFVWLF